jgi:Reverse transcriptase (RNA-dependent DNA polymerase)
MASNERSSWLQAVEEEYENMLNNGVFEPVELCDVPENAKVLSTTWVLKKKASGRYKARVTARGYEQRDGEHFDSSDKSSPVVNDISIRVILTLIVMAISGPKLLTSEELSSLPNLSRSTKCLCMFLKVSRNTPWQRGPVA